MIVIIIPAKGKSSRLPNKNMNLLLGRPMLDYSVDWARDSSRADKILLSTDCDVIAAHAGLLDVEVVRRSEALGGDVPIIEVYRHAVAEIENDGLSVSVVVGLQPDHPDRDLTVDETMEIFENEGVDRLISIDSAGTKSGAHYVLSRHFLDTGESRKDVTVTDDCTNIHFSQDLERAEARLRAARTEKS